MTGPNPFVAPSRDQPSPGDTGDGISLWTATAIVVAAMVGTGVYVGLGYQVMGLPSGFPILLIWFLGGVWALCGGLCYAELAALFPRSGGEYNLLGQAAHPLAGYLSGWVSLLAGFVAPAALGASMFGTYLEGMCGYPIGRYAAFTVLLVVAAIQFGSLRMNSAFLNIFTWLKVALIAVIIVAAFGFTESTGLAFVPQAGDARMIASRDFGIAMIYVSYAYAGWNTSTYIVGEVRNPQRNVPRSLLMGTAIVTALYVGLNAAFLNATPLEAIQGLDITEKERVGLLAAEYIFGPIGSKLVGGVICLGLVSFIASMLWAGPRIMKTMGEDYQLLSIFAVENKVGAPAVAIGISGVIALALLLLDQFNAVLTYAQFVLVLSNMATVAAMVWLRISRPEMHRPYRAWGFPLVPIVFLTLGGIALVYTFIGAPWPSVCGMVTVLLPIPLYFIGGKKP